MNEITEDPSILGLGDLVVAESEVGRPRAGHVALVLHDLQTNTRYEVRIQLGAADESHLLRTVEYRAAEKSRNPTANHVAVIIAEEITSRLLDTVGLLDRSIPIIAIQLSAWEVGRTATLDATKVLDLAFGASATRSSRPGEDWTNRDVDGPGWWSSVCFGSGLFVAVPGSEKSQVMTSPDGITWTARASARMNIWESVAYGNGLFVAVSHFGKDWVMTSPDGITWTTRSVPNANGWGSVAYGNGLFVVVGDRVANGVMTSPDGITWTTRRAPDALRWKSVAYGSGLFVAVASNGKKEVMTSPDGVTWTGRWAATQSGWSTVTYGNGLFVALAGPGTTSVMTSQDAIAWSDRLSASARTWRSVTYGNGMFVAVCSTGPGNEVMTSPDGITWTVRATTGINDWRSVTYGNGMFVAVGAGSNRVMTSGTLWTASGVPTDVTAKARDGGAIVSWTPPVDDGGTPVTAYTATASPGGATCSKFRAHSCTVGGLSNGTAYTFTVTATNAAGTSVASDSSKPLTPKRRPIPPPGT